MELKRVLGVIRKRQWLILLVIVLMAASAYATSRSTTPIYQASTTIGIEQGVDPRMDPYTALATSERSAKTYVQLMRSSTTLQQVIDRLGLRTSPGALASKVSASPVLGTGLIAINVEDEIPSRAAYIANTIVEVFAKQMGQAQDERFKQGARELDDQIAALEKQIEDKQKGIVALGDPTDAKNVNIPEFVRMEMVTLQSRLARDQAIYAILLKSREDFRLASARAVPQITVVSPAEAQGQPVRPRPMLYTLLAALSGLVAGLGIAFLLEYYQDAVEDPEDVQKLISLPTVGLILRFPHTDGAPSRPVVSASPKSVFSEAYRTLRTNIQFSSLGKALNSILVTSPGAREGKTTTAVNLAVAMAQGGKRVILVDSDLRHPNLHKVFGLEARGLTNLVLDGETNPATYLQATSLENLRVLAAGPIPPNPSELLGSENMSQLLKGLVKEADVVILDSPPVLAVTDAAVLARQVDGTLVVGEAGVTRRESLSHARDALAKVGANLIGVVLNKVARGTSGYYYYYYATDGDKHKKRKESSNSGFGHLADRKEQ